MITLSTRLAAVRGSAIRDLLTLTARPDVLSLAGGLPAAGLLPRERIAEAAATALADPASVQYGETAGLARLREVLAEHERRGRNVNVVVTTGSQQALDLLARALLDPATRWSWRTRPTSGHCRCSRRPAPRCTPCPSTPTACASSCWPSS